MGSTINDLSSTGCSSSPIQPPAPSTPQPPTDPPVSAPTDPAPSPTNPPPSPTASPPSPTTSGPSNKCCSPNETKMKAYNGCTQYYWCLHGNVQPDLVGPMSNGALFDETIQNWNWPANFECSVDQCGGPNNPPTQPTQAPVPAPTTTTPSTKCCLPNENKLKAYNGCTQYYRCVWGEVQPDLVGPMSNGALFDEGVQNWNWPANFECVVDSCGRRLRGH